VSHPIRTFAAIAAASALALGLIGCSAPAEQEATSSDGLPVVRVAGATSNPLEQASIEFIRDEVAADYGIQIDYVYIEETRVILEATENKEVDANVAMHQVYMKAQNEELGYHLAAATPLFKQRQVLYSKQYDSIEDVPDGAQIAVASSPVSTSTALVFLEELGLITLDEHAPLALVTVEDIIENPKKLQFVQVESVPRALDDVALATATAYAFYVAEIDEEFEIEAIPGLDDYALQLVVHQDNLNRDDIKALIEAFNDPRLDEYVSENWPNLVTPL
jgi:D-methionine transport system substrate-binding protein